MALCLIYDSSTCVSPSVTQLFLVRILRVEVRVQRGWSLSEGLAFSLVKPGDDAGSLTSESNY